MSCSVVFKCWDSFSHLEFNSYTTSSERPPDNQHSFLHSQMKRYRDALLLLDFFLKGCIFASQIKDILCHKRKGRESGSSAHSHTLQLGSSHSQTTNGTNVSLLASQHIWLIMNQPPFPINIRIGLFRMLKDVISLPVSFSFSLEQLILTLNSWLVVNLRLATEIWKEKSVKCKKATFCLVSFLAISSLPLPMKHVSCVPLLPHPSSYSRYLCHSWFLIIFGPHTK